MRPSPSVSMMLLLIAARSAWRRAGLREVFRLMRRRRPLSVMPVSCSPRASVWPENSPRIFASVPRRASAISLASGSGTCTSEASGLRREERVEVAEVLGDEEGGYGLAARGFLAGPAAHEEGECVESCSARLRGGGDKVRGVDENDGDLRAFLAEGAGLTT